MLLLFRNPFQSTTYHFPLPTILHLETSTLISSHLIYSTKRLKVPYICTTSIPESQILLIRGFAVRPDTYKLHSIVRQVPQLSHGVTLNTTRINTQHVCVSGVPRSHISLRFPKKKGFLKIANTPNHLGIT